MKKIKIFAGILSILFSIIACGNDAGIEQEEAEMRLNIQVGEHLLTAALEHNSSADALVEMLTEGDVTVTLSLASE